jgi:hypothetical protein
MSFDSNNLEFINGLRYCFERSKSNKSTCGNCKEIIGKDLIRLYIY